jgi:hypothetical protein
MKQKKILAMLLAIVILGHLTPLPALAGSEMLGAEPDGDAAWSLPESETLETAHTVRFYDHTGHILGFPQSVGEGEAAIAPVPAELEGFTFQGWSEPFDAVTGDMDIYPLYAVKLYIVKLLNWDGKELAKLEGVEHGRLVDTLLEPPMPHDGLVFDRWEPIRSWSPPPSALSRRTPLPRTCASPPIPCSLPCSNPPRLRWPWRRPPAKESPRPQENRSPKGNPCPKASLSPRGNPKASRPLS